MSHVNSITVAERIADNRVEPTIKALALTKLFGERLSVDQLSFQVFPGELYALLGDNGAGKTTTINMLTTLLGPTSGRFTICGYDGLRQAEKAKSMFGVVSQDVAIYQELTAYENLNFIADLYGLPRRKAAPRINLLLDTAGLADRANDKVGDFSMGMQRKLSIAVAILPEPRVLFMDEPTVGLDPASRLQIWSTLKELRGQGVTILLTTHYLEEAELLADRIGIIRQGRLVIEGTIDELRHRIESIRGVSITLKGPVDPDDLQRRVARCTAVVNARSHFDPLRNTLSFMQPKDLPLTHLLDTTLQWLKQEKIPFSRFTTSEPSLEDIFLTIVEREDDIQISPGRNGAE